MYNMIHGFDPAAATILKMMNLDHAAIPRFRDAYFGWHDEANQIPKIVILTRTGGGNRETYQKENDTLRQVVGYISDEDDTFDSTYALWSYECASDRLNDLAVVYLRTNGRPLSLREKTDNFIKQMKTGERPIPKPFVELFEKIKNELDK